VLTKETTMDGQDLTRNMGNTRAVQQDTGAHNGPFLLWWLVF